MGGWKLEAGRMGLYMAFPVILFYYFNQPQYFEEWVTKTRREIFPPDNTPETVELRKAIRDIQKEQEFKRIQMLSK